MSTGPRTGAELQRLVLRASGAALAVLAMSLPTPALAEPRQGGRVVAAAAESSGLVVDISSVAPSTLTPGESLEITGTVTNGDDHPWRRVQAYLVISQNPLTSRSQLAAAAESPVESYIGDRILAQDRFAVLGRLAVGESAPFRLRVPYGTLPISGADGVYSVGVQVLATDVDETRLPESLARSRTFVPLVSSDRDDRAARVRLAAVLPLRASVLRRPDGTYVRAPALRTSLEPGGRLRRLVDLAETAGDVPLTLVVDPAVLDAADDLGRGRFGPPERNRDGRLDQPAPDTTPDTTPDTNPDEPTDGGEPPIVSPAAEDWLQDVRALFGTSGMVTRYAEPDEVVLARSPRVAAATTRATRVTTSMRLGVQATSMVFVDDRPIDPAVLAPLGGPDGNGVAVLSARQLIDWEPQQGAVVQLAVGAAGAEPLEVLVADPALTAGGPTPADPQSALQMRQRLLAETALLSLAADGRGERSATAAFIAPPRWDPGPSWPAADFFSGLQTPWLRPVPLADLRTAARPYAGAVSPDAPAGTAPDLLLAADLARASEGVARNAQTLVRLLGGDPPLARWYDAAAALGMSARTGFDGARRLAATRATAADLGRQLRQVSIDGPTFVTLSSSQGRFGVTITNGLDRPVTVGVRVEADADGLKFDTGDPVRVAPGERETVTVDTQVGSNRVTGARAYLVTATGQRFGQPLTFSLRTSVVGVVIWAVLGVAGLILVAAIVRRVVRRVRAARPAVGG